MGSTAAAAVPLVSAREILGFRRSAALINIRRLHEDAEYNNACKVVRRFFKFVTRLIQQELDTRTLEHKRTHEGKRSSAIARLNEAYLKPLLKRLKKKVRPLLGRARHNLLPLTSTYALPQTISEDLLSFFSRIVAHVTNREYRKAQDGEQVGCAPAWCLAVRLACQCALEAHNVHSVS